MQVKRDDHTFSSTTVWNQRYTPQIKKSGHDFIYLDDYNLQRQMNKQSGFNAGQIDKDKNLESKNCLKIKSKNNELLQQNKKPLDHQINK
jgi:hypothetical protein